MELEVGHGETEVYARARRLVTIIDRSSEFIGFAAMDGTAQYVNPAGRNLLGLSSDAPISHLRIFDFLAEHGRGRALQTLLPIVLRIGRWLGELDLRHFKTGEVRSIPRRLVSASTILAPAAR
jgi:PAS domain-containing protein